MFIAALGLAFAAVAGAAIVLVRLALGLWRRRHARTSGRVSVVALVLSAGFSALVSLGCAVFAGAVGIFAAFCDYGGSCVDDFLRPIAGVLVLAVAGDVAALVDRWNLARFFSAVAAAGVGAYLALAFLPRLVKPF